MRRHGRRNEKIQNLSGTPKEKLKRMQNDNV